MAKIWPPYTKNAKILSEMAKILSKMAKIWSLFTKYGQNFTLLYKKCYFPNWARNAGGYALIGVGLQNDQNLEAGGGPRLIETWEYDELKNWTFTDPIW